jgi:hypothetical protein
MSRKIKPLVMAVVLAVSIQVAHSQTIQVKGLVVDENEQPVIGAAVVVKGTDIN